MATLTLVQFINIFIFDRPINNIKSKNNLITTNRLTLIIFYTKAR